MNTKLHELETMSKTPSIFVVNKNMSRIVMQSLKKFNKVLQSYSEFAKVAAKTESKSKPCPTFAQSGNVLHELEMFYIKLHKQT